MFPNENNLETHFTFENDSASAVEEIPFRLLIFGDWSGNAEKPGINQRRPIEIDRDNFDEVINQFNVSLKLAFFDSDAQNLRLTFEKLDDFHPDYLFNQISLFDKLRDLRKRLSNQRDYNNAVREILAYSELGQFSHDQSSTGHSSETNDSTDLLDQILAQKAGSETTTVQPTIDDNGFSRFIGDIIQPHLIKIDLGKQEQFIEAVDESISSLMRKILHHESFQTLESAWRGLYFLIMNTQTDSNLKIYLYDITKSELTEHLKSYDNLADSPFCQTIFQNDPEFKWTLLSANFSFDLNIDDVAFLMRLAKISAYNNVSFVSHLPITKSNSYETEDKLKKWVIDGDDAALKLWTTLRSQPESEYLGLLTTRFLVRLPFGTDTEPLEEFDFEEFESNIVFNNYLWANPCFAFSYLITKTFSQFGWEIQRNFIKEIDNLSAHIYRKDGETIFQSPLEDVLNLQETEKILELGLMPFISYKNSNIVRLTQSKSVSGNEKFLSGRWN